jgi:hypothetical protein
MESPTEKQLRYKLLEEELDADIAEEAALAEADPDFDLSPTEVYYRDLKLQDPEDKSGWTPPDKRPYESPDRSTPLSAHSPLIKSFLDDYHHVVLSPFFPTKESIDASLLEEKEKEIASFTAASRVEVITNINDCNTSPKKKKARKVGQ